MFDYEILRVIWWALIGVLFIGFAVTDGFDMGVGALLPIIGKDDTERRIMVNTIAPHWDGNQVWLITAGGALFAAWPMVYAVSFSGFYVAMMLVLFALYTRPVGFDYRSKIENPKWRKSWDWALFCGGFIPPLIIGVAFGNLLQGVPFNFDEFLRATYHGGLFGLLNPFGLLAGLVSVSMFMMQGAAWLQMKTDGELQARAVHWARRVLWPMGVALVAISAATPLVNPAVVEKWFGVPQIFALLPVPLMCAAAFFGVRWVVTHPEVVKAGYGWLVFVNTVLIFVLAFFGLAYSIFPDIVIGRLDVWEAAAATGSLTVIFIGVAITLPVIVAYTIFMYRVFWGKARELSYS